MSKKDYLEIDVYILCLHKFVDDKVILDKRELEKASEAICDCLRKRKYLKEERPKEIDRWYVYRLDPRVLPDEEMLYEKIYRYIVKAELGYYHHRSIVKFSLSYPKCDFSGLREIRQELKEKADNIINTCAKDRINNLTLSGDMKNEGIIKFLYTYPFVIVKNDVEESETIPFSQETGTLSFDIYEPGFLNLSSKRSLMRVSGPSIILYTHGDIDNRLLRDIINAIYQHCLYEKKLDDEKKGLLKINWMKAS